MAEDQTFFQGCENITDSPGAESLVSVPPQDTLMENSDCDQENWHVRFRTFSSSEESDPVKDLKRLRELCHLWLRPDLHTKEQMMDRLVLEQFMICMPLECQVLLKETGVQSCKDLEDVLRNKQKPKNWTIVCIQGQKYLVRDPDIEMVEAKAGHMDDERDLCGGPQPSSRVIPPEDGQEGSTELQNLPGATNLSREQDERALPPETVPETGELEGLTPRENLEKDLLEDRGETKTLQSEAPQLLKGPEGDVSTLSGSRRGPLKNCRHVKRKRDSSPSCQDMSQEAATCLDQGEFSEQLGSRSVGSSGSVGPTSLPEGAETPGRAPSEYKLVSLASGENSVFLDCRFGGFTFSVRFPPPAVSPKTEERMPAARGKSKSKFQCFSCVAGLSFRRPNVITLLEKGKAPWMVDPVKRRRGLGYGRVNSCLIAKESLENSDIDKSPLHQYTEVPPLLCFCSANFINPVLKDGTSLV
ncbi:hypothetical protein E5288_WYG007405 [Bos mutus]|uniref:SCAN box domain-containing protein n=1 Tax=Bos mutus TaxID=72004 RepID=A0A6B0S6A9_9CETA|nr:hypothetical protein [Bos mutus]